MLCTATEEEAPEWVEPNSVDLRISNVLWVASNTNLLLLVLESIPLVAEFSSTLVVAK